MKSGLSVPLNARVRIDGGDYPGGFEWRVNDPSTIELIPSEDGLSCDVKPLAVTEKGGTILIVSCPTMALELRIPVQSDGLSDADIAELRAFFKVED